MGWDEKVETERNKKKRMKNLYSILMLHGVFIDTLQYGSLFISYNGKIYELGENVEFNLTLFYLILANDEIATWH